MQQRKRRHELIHWLTSYRDGGEFPHNDGVAVQPIPIFRDDRDVLCAMAYLISRSGHVDIVNRVAATRNFAYIAGAGVDMRVTRSVLVTLLVIPPTPP